MRRTRGSLLATIFLIAAASLTVASAPPPRASDPLAREIDRWQAFVRDVRSTDETWQEIKGGAQEALTGAEQALHAGRRLLALQRLGTARVYLAAFSYTAEHPEAAKSEKALEAEWDRMGRSLGTDLRPGSAAALATIEPAAVRALAETAWPQIREFYDASIEYGRNTTPSSGVFYLGSAQAERDFARFCRSVAARTGRRPPPLRPLPDELDGLESDLLAVYRPPASIDRHGDFISASSVLKEARELDAAGLRAGAMLRYLQASQRVAALRAAPAAAADAASAAAALDTFEKRAASDEIDHSIATLFVESARASLAVPNPPVAARTPAPASLIAAEVLPRYFAALEPAKRREPASPPAVTVTLVRWPYT